MLDALTGKRTGSFNDNIDSQSPIISKDGFIFTENNLKLNSYDTTSKTSKWSFALTGSNNGIGIPLIQDGVAYVMGLSSITALETSTGKTKWSNTSVNLSGGLFEYSPSILNGTLYVPAYDKKALLALNLTTGATKWTYQSKYYMNKSPYLVNGDLIGASQNDIYNVNASDGTLKQTIKTYAFQLGSFTVLDGVMYLSGGANFKFPAIDLAKGTDIWSFSTGFYYPFSTSTISDGLVYFYTSENKLYALDIKTGEVKWNYSGVNNDFTIANGFVYALVGNNLTVLDAKTGVLKWNYSEINTKFYPPSIIDKNGKVNYNGRITNQIQ